MAEKGSEKGAEEVQQASPPAGRRKLMMLGLLAGVMLGEALVVFVLVKTFMVPPPSPAEAAGVSGTLNPAEGQQAVGDAEVKVAQLRAQNNKTPRTVVYDLTLYAVVSESDREAFTRLVEANKARIEDRFTRVVRNMDPERFTEPDLATLRNQFKFELDRMTEKEGMIKEVLIPSASVLRDD